MEDGLADTILQHAQEPESAAADGVSVRRHSLRDLIAADKYLRAKRALADPASALAMYQIVERRPQ